MGKLGTKKQFTHKFLQGLKPQNTRYTIYDEGRPGFGIRITPSGKKSFIYVYQLNGKFRRMTFGEFPQLRLEDARAQYQKANAQVAKSKRTVKEIENGELSIETASFIDPAEEKKQRRNIYRSIPTVKEYAETYLSHSIKHNRLTTHNGYVRIFNKYIIPALGNKKLKALKRRNMAEVVGPLQDKGAFVMANRVQSVVITFMNHALDKGIIEFNPFQGMKKTPENERERALSDSEILQFWTRLPNTDMSEGLQFALKLILITGQRPGEVAGANDDELETPDLWVIPKERFKRKRGQRVPLSPLAASLISSAKKINNGSRFWFPSTKSGGVDKPISELSLAAGLRRNIDILGCAPFTPHDLRRTCRTQLAKLSISPEIAELVIGHAKKDMEKVYNQYSYDPEKRRALETWARKIDAILSGETENILEFKTS